MASNVADTIIFFKAQAATVADLGDDVTGTAGILGIQAVPSRCQVKQFGFIITVDFGTQTTDVVYKLQQLPAMGTAVDLITATLGPTNTKLVFPTIATSVVAAGGPDTLYTGPALAGNRTVNTLATLVKGVVCLCPRSEIPTLVLAPGDGLQVNRTVAAAGGSAAGEVVPFVRLEWAGEQGMELTNVALEVD